MDISEQQRLIDIVWSPDVTETTLASLATANQYLTVLAGIATRSESPETLQQLSREPVWTIRRIVAMNDAAPAALLTTLLNDEIVDVRRAVLVNPALADTARRGALAQMTPREFRNTEPDWCVRLGDIMGGPGTGSLLMVLRTEQDFEATTSPLELCDVAVAAINNPTSTQVSN